MMTCYTIMVPWITGSLENVSYLLWKGNLNDYTLVTEYFIIYFFISYMVVKPIIFTRRIVDF